MQSVSKSSFYYPELLFLFRMPEFQQQKLRFSSLISRMNKTFDL